MQASHWRIDLDLYRIADQITGDVVQFILSFLVQTLLDLN